MYSYDSELYLYLKTINSIIFTSLIDWKRSVSFLLVFTYKTNYFNTSFNGLLIHLLQLELFSV